MQIEKRCLLLSLAILLAIIVISDSFFEKEHHSEIFRISGQPNQNATLDFINITPNLPYAYQNLSINLTCTDTDDLNVFVYWNIYNNSVIEPLMSHNITISSGTNFNIFNISYTNTSVGENWTAEIWCGDALFNTSKQNATVLIRNSPPTQSIPIINSTDNLNRTNGTLNCYNQSTFDTDDDTITNQYIWYKDDTEIGGETTSSLANTNFVKPNVLICSINATDGTDWNITNSTSLTILNTNVTINNTGISDPFTANADTYYFIYDTNASDLDVDDAVDTLTFYINDTKLTIDSATGVIEDTPEESQNGTYLINVSVTDGSTWSNFTFNYHIYDNIAPRFQNNATNDTTIYYDDWIRLNATAIDGFQLRNYVFSSNASGTWTNYSAVPISGNQTEINYSVQNQITGGHDLGWYFIVNDTNNNVGIMTMLNMTISNSIPEISSILLELNNISNGTFNNYILNATISDRDNDIVGWNFTNATQIFFSNESLAINITTLTFPTNQNLSINDSAGIKTNWTIHFNLTNEYYLMNGTLNFSKQHIGFNTTFDNLGNAMDLNWSHYSIGTLLKGEHGSIQSMTGIRIVNSTWYGDWITESNTSIVQNLNLQTVIDGTAYATINFSATQNSTINFTDVELTCPSYGTWSLDTSANQYMDIQKDTSSILPSVCNFSKSNVVTSNITTVQQVGVAGADVLWNKTIEIRNLGDITFINMTKSLSLDATAYNIACHFNGTVITNLDMCKVIGTNVNLKFNYSLTANNKANISITYLTTGVTKSEGSITQGTAEIGKPLLFSKTVIIGNPSSYTYTDIQVNASVTSNINQTDILLKNPNGNKVGTTYHSSSNTINWTIANVPPSYDNKIWNLKWNSTPINYSKTNSTTLESGFIYLNVNLSIYTNSTEILDIISYTNFTEGVATDIFECENGVGCTRINDRSDVVFSDRSGNGYYDYVSWYADVSNYTLYKIKTNAGDPVNINEELEILNEPISPFENIEWRNTITLRNNNSLATEVVYKISPPINVFSMTLDGISKTLSYPSQEEIEPYIILSDKTDPSHTSSIYLDPFENLTLVLEYQTDPVTISLTREYPEYIYVGEEAHIIMMAKVKNWVNDNVTDIEHDLFIDYGTELRQCIGEYDTGCSQNRTTKEEDIVNGKYTFSVDVLEANQIETYTIDYYIPTVRIEESRTGKRGVNGTLYNYKYVKFKSVTSETFKDVRYKEEKIDCGDVFEVTDSLGRDLEYSCGSVNVWLGIFNPAETKDVYIWTKTKQAEITGYSYDVITWFSGFFTRFSQWGKVLYSFEEGSFWYKMFGEEMLIGEISMILIIMIIISSVVFGMILLRNYYEKDNIEQAVRRSFKK